MLVVEDAPGGASEVTLRWKDPDSRKTMEQSWAWGFMATLDEREFNADEVGRMVRDVVAWTA